MVGLLHLVFVALLLHHAAGRRVEDQGAVIYMRHVVPEAASPAAQRGATQAPRVAVPRLRPPAQRTSAAPQLAPIPAPAPQETPAAPAAAAEPPPSSPGLDMLSLRADARNIDKGRMPEPFEQVRDAEHRLEAEKNDLGRAIARAKRPPCTKKYSGGTSLDLVLLIPLAIDTITGTGCKW